MYTRVPFGDKSARLILEGRLLKMLSDKYRR